MLFTVEQIKKSEAAYSRAISRGATQATLLDGWESKPTEQLISSGALEAVIRQASESRIEDAEVWAKNILGDKRDSKIMVNDAPMNAVAFLVPQLAKIETLIQTVQYSPLTYRNLVTVDNSVDPLDDHVMFYRLGFGGNPNYGVDLATTDIPMINSERSADRAELFNGTLGYTVTKEEIGKALRTGTNLDAQNALYCRQAVERAQNTIALKGWTDPKTKFTCKGLFDLPSGSVGTTINATKDFVTSAGAVNVTYAEFSKQLDDFLEALHVSTAYNVLTDRLIFDTTYFSAFSREIINTTDVRVTYIEAYLANNYVTRNGGTLQIVSDFNLNGFGVTGNANTQKHRIVATSSDGLNSKMYQAKTFSFEQPQMQYFRIELFGSFKMSPFVVIRKETIGYLQRI